MEILHYRKRGIGKMKRALKKPKCSICGGHIHLHKDENGKIYWRHGHNAQPINNGRCCDNCNQNLVFPARIKRLHQNRPLREVDDQPNLFEGGAK